ncbi:nucleoside transporter C-terminal domain-containing protein (plasmid) [Photobacterium sp. DA100]|uniref:NupC/NupG family nucleoside CNT transporter n=1 Tax=Photobacterium sp. DA100 TaxID=3027472 RepID=UPI002479EDA4|nr:nucleoside transporter C-terminal domain-containing protein [Photobacterium sp. DA100]WEM44938.1 nucleoside transporter C-terminal domain-containing protein [Photobacterium sp. DA100]
MQTLIPLFGIATLLFIGWVFSCNRKAIKLRTVGVALALQASIAAFILFVPAGQVILIGISSAVSSIMDYSGEGIRFLFGELGAFGSGFIFAIHVLPIIIFFSAFMSVLYYLGVMQRLVKYIGMGVQKVLGTSQAESTAAAANIFIGNTDVFVMMKPYAPKMTKSELFALMTGGFASIAGSVLVGFAGMGIEIKYLVSAAFMSAPAGLLFAKIIYPETDEPVEVDLDIYHEEDKPINIIEAATSGAFNGLKMASAIGVMLLALIALIAMFNGMLGSLFELVGIEGVTLQSIFGYMFAPIAFLLGVPSSEVLIAGNFLGQKLVLNEFVAFMSFSEVRESLSHETQAIITMALAGFANLSAPAAMIGVLGTIVPKMKPFIASMGVRVILAATLANLMSAAITGLFISFV